MKFGIISDTHAWLDPSLESTFKTCDEIWHAGDIGNSQVIDTLRSWSKVRAVYGNIDGGNLRQEFREVEVFDLEGIRILMIHIANKPPRYTPQVKSLIKEHQPDILVCGHSHILRVLNDKPNKILFINPGAAGRSGFQQVRTVITMHITDGKIHDLKVIELGPRSKRA